MLCPKAVFAAALTISAFCVLTASQALGAVVPSKAQFIARADAYCRVIEPKIRSPARELKHESVRQAPKTIDDAANVEAHALSHLRTITEPAGAHPVLSKIWNSYGSLITYTRKAAADIKANGIAQFNHDSGAASIAQARFRGLAQGFGFKYCGAGKNVG